MIKLLYWFIIGFYDRSRGFTEPNPIWEGIREFPFTFLGLPILRRAFALLVLIAIGFLLS